VTKIVAISNGSEAGMGPPPTCSGKRQRSRTRRSATIEGDRSTGYKPVVDAVRAATATTASSNVCRTTTCRAWSNKIDRGGGIHLCRAVARVRQSRLLQTFLERAASLPALYDRPMSTRWPASPVARRYSAAHDHAQLTANCMLNRRSLVGSWVPGGCTPLHRGRTRHKDEEGRTKRDRMSGPGDRT